jgi:hypothetical protein
MQELAFLGKTISDAEQLKNLKQIVVENVIENEYQLTNGLATVQCARYKTKIIRPGPSQVNTVHSYCLHFLAAEISVYRECRLR